MPKRLSTDLLVLLAQAALANGRDLIADAELLLGAGRVPRTIALSILATEELSKTLLVWCWLLAERKGKSVDPTVLRKGLRNHKAKLVMPSIVREAFRSSVGASLEDEIKRLIDYVPEATRHAETSDRIKQNAFYVHFTDEKVESPSESISESHAKASLDLAKSWARVLEMFQRWLVQDGLLPT